MKYKCLCKYKIMWCDYITMWYEKKTTCFDMKRTYTQPIKLHSTDQFSVDLCFRLEIRWTYTIEKSKGLVVLITITLYLHELGSVKVVFLENGNWRIHSEARRKGERAHRKGGAPHAIRDRATSTALRRPMTGTTGAVQSREYTSQGAMWQQKQIGSH